MTRSTKLLSLVLIVALAPLGIAACGGDDGGGGGSGGGGKEGGILKLGHTSMPDYLDPALSFTVDGWQALLQTYPGLLAFPHKSGPAGAEPVPGLAEAMPEISEDGKTYKLKLRDNLTFSDGKPITASDFKASVERVLAQDSQGASFYTGIEGGEEFLKTKKGGLTGIEANDQTGDITIKLTKPRGDFNYLLAIPFSGIVPQDTPKSNRTKNPPPGAGRYVISDVKINRSYKMRSNTNFSDSLKGTAVDAGKAEGFDVGIYGSEARQVTLISQNKLDFMVDNPPPDRVADVKAKFDGKRWRQFSTPSTFYFFMNAEVPPFDNVKVRQALNHAIDTDAINRIQGGVIEETNEILPAPLPGHKDTPDLYPHDINKAKQLIKEAGAEGDKVTVWGNPEVPTKPTVEYLADTLNEIGLDAKVKIVAGSVYFATIGDRSVKAQTGWANWFQDYPHPGDFIDVLLNPDNVVATGNNNYSYNAKDKELARKINAVKTEPELTEEVKAKWAEIDLDVQKKAYWGLYGTRKQTTFFSERMDFENCKGDNFAAGTHDWAQFCLK